ncbi:MAG: hypothetical protein DRJ52_08455 [Thermoprotei archaeon]|nr:MAG: hypothetical protein DRJ52_08455 [Thermoprotei archaeon]
MSLVPRIFPYEYPRLAQIEIWSALSKLNESRVIFIEAPTGVGKTVALLSYLLEKYDKVLWFCYTHRQQEVVLKEARRIEEKIGVPLNTVLIRGISTLCPVKEVRESDIPHILCRKVGFKCVLCPYREQFLKALSARVVVATYAYLKPRFFQRIAEILESADVVVLDEAHHLLLPPKIEISIQWAEKVARVDGNEVIRKMLRREKSIRFCEDFAVSEFGEEILARLKEAGIVYYDKKEDKYVGLYKDFHSFLREKIREKKIVVTSATLPEQIKCIIGNGAFYRVHRHEYRFYPVIYSGIKLPKRAWKYKRFLKEVDWVLSVASKFYRRVLAVFPSRELLERYGKKYNNVIFIVAGSREAEGIDVDADIAIVLGVPYDRVSKITVETVKYFRRYSSRPKLIGYELPAIIKAVQAIGRVLRKSNRVVVFFDERWIKLKKYFPAWLKNEGIKISSKRPQLYNELIFYSCLI